MKTDKEKLIDQLGQELFDRYVAAGKDQALAMAIAAFTMGATVMAKAGPMGVLALAGNEDFLLHVIHCPEDPWESWQMVRAILAEAGIVVTDVPKPADVEKGEN